MKYEIFHRFMRLFYFKIYWVGFYWGFCSGGVGGFSITIILLLFITIIITFAGDNFLASYSNGLYYIILIFFCDLVKSQVSE